jgi:hypothetical protein
VLNYSKNGRGTRGAVHYIDAYEESLTANLVVTDIREKAAVKTKVTEKQ